MSKKLRIGIVCYPSIGGSGIVATQLGQALCERKYEVHYISHDMPQRLGKMKNKCTFHRIHVPVYPLFRYPPYTLALATELTRLVDEVGLDLLHVHYAIPHSTSAVLANLMLQDKGRERIPIVTTVHGTDTELVGKEPVYKPAVEFSLNHCDALTAVSENLKKTTLESFDCRQDIRVVYNFVDPETFCPPEKEGFPRNGQQWQIAHISNFRPVKRILDVIRIFDCFAKCVPSRLLMVGDGPDRREAEDLVESLGLAKQVSFTGHVLEVESILRKTDVLLCTSENESFGMTVCEALASGVPVVATRAGGLPEVIEDGRSGILADVGDVDSMAEAVLQIIMQPELGMEIGRGARKRVLEHFSPDIIVPQYEELYEKLALAVL